MTDKFLQYFIYAVFALITFGVTSWVAKLPPFMPSGLVLPAEVVRPAISPDQVTIYNSTPPAAFTTLGIIHVETHFDKLSPQMEAATIAYARKLAAEVGANGLLFDLRYDQPGMVSPAGLQKYILIGAAINTGK